MSPRLKKVEADFMKWAQNQIDTLQKFRDKYLGKNLIERKNKADKKLSNLTIASAILPIIITFLSGYMYLITQQFLTLIISLVDVAPPWMLKNTKSDIDRLVKGIDLELKIDRVIYNIKNLIALGKFKDERVRDHVKTSVEKIMSEVRDYMKQPTA